MEDIVEQVIEKEAAQAAETVTAETVTDAVEVDETIEIFDIVPTAMASQEDMKHISDIDEEFYHTMDPILRMYHAAMSATETRLTIIKDEFKYRGLRCPIHHIDSRLKSTKSILGKLEKKGLHLSLQEACNNLYDIAGVRVVCQYIKDVYLIKERLLAQDDIHIMEIKDYIANPKKNGYRSLHMIIRVPVYFMNKKQMVPVEVQIRTEAMDMWASLEHDIKYKSLYQDIGVDFTGELLECSKLIYQAEEKMEYMNNLLES
jgi:putative GTP pyrophosphokinase